ncbi:hypothetical protein GCM10018966_086670 [Streptomyces yanii]
MDPSPGRLRLEAGTEQHIEPGGITEFESRTVDHQSGPSLFDRALQGFAEQIGGVVIQLTHRRHHLTAPLGPDLDMKSTPVRTADRLAVHARPSSPFVTACVTVRVTLCDGACGCVYSCR